MRLGAEARAHCCQDEAASSSATTLPLPTCKPVLQPGQQKGGLRLHRFARQHHAPCRRAGRAQRLRDKVGWCRQRRRRRRAPTEGGGYMVAGMAPCIPAAMIGGPLATQRRLAGLGRSTECCTLRLCGMWRSAGQLLLAAKVPSVRSGLQEPVLGSGAPARRRMQAGGALELCIEQSAAAGIVRPVKQHAPGLQAPLPPVSRSRLHRWRCNALQGT